MLFLKAQSVTRVTKLCYFSAYFQD